MLEEAMVNIPESGDGRVMHLVNAFERLLSITKDKSDESNGDKHNNKGKVMTGHYLDIRKCLLMLILLPLCNLRMTLVRIHALVVMLIG